MKTIKSVILICALFFSMIFLYSCVTTGVPGPQGVQGEPGKDGEDGHTPEITIGENGNWYIDGDDTNVSAKGEQGESGKDGSSLLTGNGSPSSNLGKNGDSYIDLDAWYYYIKVGDNWEIKGNIKADSNDHDGTDGLEFYLLEDGTYGVAIGTAKYLKEIVIPSTYKNKAVTYIITFGFSCGIFETITIPNSIKGIGDCAFKGCSSLTSITIPEGVEKIGDYAFADCNSLTNIEIPKSVTSIGQDSFYCENLENVYFYGMIEDWCNITLANSYCTPMYYARCFYMLNENNEFFELTEIVIPDTITSINDYQFYGFDNVTNIVIPTSVTTIGDEAFAGCYRLISITIPESVTSIGQSTFSNCFNLKSIVISGFVTSIGQSAFSGCSNLISITIPETVTNIGFEAFKGCSSLISIIIPEKVTSIDFCAFFNCSRLTIYCEVSEKQDGWDSWWNYSNRQVYWAGQWEYDANGNPVPLN